MSFSDALNQNVRLAEQDAGFIGADLEIDAEQIAQERKQALASRIPGWESHPAQPEDQLIDQVAVVAAGLRQLAVVVAWHGVIATFATEILGIRRRGSAPAIAQSVWTAQEGKDGQVSAGDTIALPRGAARIAFEVIQTTEIPAGESVPVEMRAVEPGAVGNGLQGVAEPDVWPDWLESVDVPAPTDFGVDEQDQADFLNLVSRLLSMVAFRPVKPEDFATLTMYLVPGMQNARIVVLDTHNPDTGTWGNKACVTLLVADQQGEPWPDPVKDAIRGMLTLQREVGFVVFVRDFNYQTVDVGYAVRTFRGQDPDMVKAVCDSAVAQLVSPAWRLGTTSPATGVGEVIPPPQDDRLPGRQTIWRSDLVALLKGCRGVDSVDLDRVTINGQAADFVLDSETTLPRLGNLTGEVTVG